MKNVNEHLIGYWDRSTDTKALREFSLENAKGFTVMVQASGPSVDYVTVSLYAKMALFDDADLAALVATPGAEVDEGLTTTYTPPERWVLIKSETLNGATFGEGNPGWAVTDAGSGYKAIKVVVQDSGSDSIFFTAQVSTLTNK